jgi:hypothetical protein
MASVLYLNQRLTVEATSVGSLCCYSEFKELIVNFLESEFQHLNLIMYIRKV